ncbi:PEP-CTERM sorting domain-containing protein [Chitinolyticbacter albus]|uniref:PEP-CTERM sorting domain-containing protein n=1 Tax=Chitinolyticbacter albus TaxID=2961951 RepID=UPI00210D1FD8|nr:PEP-CTERM sorting domain-containing protein [Chitinolyticbacter albus]
MNRTFLGACLLALSISPSYGELVTVEGRDVVFTYETYAKPTNWSFEVVDNRLLLKAKDNKDLMNFSYAGTHMDGAGTSRNISFELQAKPGNRIIAFSPSVEYRSTFSSQGEVHVSGGVSVALEVYKPNVYETKWAAGERIRFDSANGNWGAPESWQREDWKKYYRLEEPLRMNLSFSHGIGDVDDVYDHITDGYSRYSFAFTEVGLNVITAPVPEPETYALMGCGLIGLWGVRRKKAKTTNRNHED